MSTMPKPDPVIKARCADVAGGVAQNSARSATVSVGLSVHTHAAAAATIGEEKLVPASPSW